MNIRNWSGKKKVSAIMIAVLLIVGLVATIFIVQTRLETRTRAEKATILSLTPATQTAQVNQQVDLDVNINPGVNQVDFVKMVINFDPAKFDANSTSFTIDPNSDFQRTANDVVGNGQITITLDIGSNPIDVIRTPQKIGTLSLLVGVQNDTQEADLIAGETQITFNEPLTEVRSIGPTDTYQENVLSSTTPATIVIEAVCRPDIATCSWDPSANATSYHYVITNVDEDVVVEDGYTTETFIDFTISSGVNYSCSVTAENECGVSEPGEDLAVCGELISPTPTATPSGSVTPTQTPSSTPTPTTTPTVTPTNIPGATSTPTPTNEPTTTPTPTDIVYEESYVENSPTPTYPIENTPTPSMPPTGNPVVVVGGIIGGVLVLLGGLLLLAL